MLGREKSLLEEAVLGGVYEWIEAEDGSDKGGGVPMESRLAEPKEARLLLPSEGWPS